MFKRLLIANRGEIARRIIRTCQALNIETIAIYSDADAQAPYVQEATYAYAIGGNRVHESYLNIEKVLNIAKEAQVDAIHPGYGLLSENAQFAEACAAANIKFIGPTSAVISQMGSKVEARKAMAQAGVPIVPGNDGAISTSEQAIQVAQVIGYPVMLKASAGGGGIGMQIVRSDEELEKAFEGNRKRAQDFFGDGTMFIEKLIEQPHHIEIQIAADDKGNVIYLGERECSIQRRHQKVIEEARSPFLDEETRQKMGHTAVLAAKAIGYTNVGTVEFLVDAHKNFYFLEMNTRLQVEHPVTEAITGFDLVELQLAIASGQCLPLKQEDVVYTGHAIEARIYAEDPVTFFPSPGTIKKMVLPNGEGIRHDNAVVEGATITPFYDPMIGKLIVHKPTREEAIAILEEALSQYTIEGIKTNIPLLLQIVRNELFKAGETTTDFVQQQILQQV